MVIFEYYSFRFPAHNNRMIEMQQYTVSIDLMAAQSGHMVARCRNQAKKECFQSHTFSQEQMLPQPEWNC